VYYGPGLCGKTTNLAWIHDNFEGGERGKMISLATEGDRTIFFDLLPIEIGAIRGMDVTLQLYTVPGQVHYNSTRQLVLRGADGVVFVADSQKAMQDSNIESFKNLQENLLLQGINLEGFPLALQFNKRDLSDTISVEDLDADLNQYSVPIFEAIATEGVGVQETLEGIVKLVMRSLRERYEGATAGTKTPGIEDPSARRQPVSVPDPPKKAPTPAAPPPVQPVEPPAPVPEPRIEPPPAAAASPPAGDVFAADLGAQTTDFSDSAGQSAPVSFEDEVSTDVYEVDNEPVELEGDAVVFDEPTDVRAMAPESDPDIRIEPAAPAPPVVEPTGDAFVDEPTAGSLDTSDLGDGPEVPPASPDIPGAGDPSLEFQIPEPSLEQDLADLTSAPPAPDQPADDIQIPPLGGEPDGFGADAAAPSAELDLADFHGLAPEEKPAPAEMQDVGPVAEPEAAEFQDLGPVGEPDVAEIEFISTPEEGEAPPPAADMPIADGRYVDQIRAPSPFVLQPKVADVVEPAAAAAALGAETLKADSTDEIMQAFSAGEDLDALASVGDEGEVELASPDAGSALTEDSDEFSFDPEAAAAAVQEAEPVVEEDVFEPAAAAEPVMVGEGDPFAEAVEPVAEEAAAAIESAERRAVDVSAEDNQLHLRLQGTGAIVESGQMRAVDIEVPVPGAWVGNQRVTLQLRLTLVPDSEGENDGSGGSS
jgi:signal recognition particle receptor subunit beta